MEKEFNKSILMEKDDEIDLNGFSMDFRHFSQKRSQRHEMISTTQSGFQFISKPPDGDLNKIKNID